MLTNSILMACKMIRLRKRQEAYLAKIAESPTDAIDIVIDGHKDSVLMKEMLKVKDRSGD